MSQYVKTFVDIFVYVVYFALIARVIFSWLPIGSATNPIVALVYQITEPVLAPLRRIVPRVFMFDLTPMIAIMLLFLLQRIVNEAL